MDGTRREEETPEMSLKYAVRTFCTYMVLWMDPNQNLMCSVLVCASIECQEDSSVILLTEKQEEKYHLKPLRQVREHSVHVGREQQSGG